MEEKEIWKDIKGYEVLYQISNLGRVKSLQRLVWNGVKMFMLKERIKKDVINKSGYHQIHLYKNGKRNIFLVHRLVYENFVGEIPDGKDVNHIDECKDNNSLSNLNLMTHKENCNYSTRNQRVYTTHLNRKDESKPIKVFKYPSMEYIETLPSFAEAGRKYGTFHIYEVIKGIHKQDKGYTFQLV